MQFTKEQLIKKAQEQIAFCRHTKITGEGRAHVNRCAALFEIALAALTAPDNLLATQLRVVELETAIKTHSESTHFCEVCGKDDPCATDDVCSVLHEPCALCGVISERPNGAHYCHSSGGGERLNDQ